MAQLRSAAMSRYRRYQEISDTDIVRLTRMTQCKVPWTLTASPYGMGSAPLVQAPDDYLRVAPVFFAVFRIRWPAGPSHGDGEPHMVEREQKTRNHPSCRRWNCRHFSARVLGKDKDLAGINTIWISDLVPVRFVNDCVSHARAVGDTADAPEAVATGYDRGCDLGHDYSGR
jgi:hypothetical protein